MEFYCENSGILNISHFIFDYKILFTFEYTAIEFNHTSRLILYRISIILTIVSINNSLYPVEL